MPSACAQFGSSVEKHTIAVRNAFASIGIHIPKIVGEWKTTAWLTENQPYHNAAIDGETPETLDPQHIILRFIFRSPRKFPASRKKIPGLKKYDISTGEVGVPAGPSGIHLVATPYFDSLDALKAGLASPQGQAAAGDLANFADGGAELYFFDTKDVGTERNRYAGPDQAG